MSDFIEIGATEGFADGSMRLVEIEGHSLLVARSGDDYYIADDRCPHMGGRLHEGVLEGTVLTCPLHHSQFDLTDGRVIRWTDFRGAILSVAKLIRHPRPLRTYEAKVADGRLLAGPEKTPPATG